MSSPWAKIYVPEPLNLKEIISQEIAKESRKCKISRESSTTQSELCGKLLENHQVTDAGDGVLVLDSESYSDEEEIENVDEDKESSQHSDEVISNYDIILKSKPSVLKCSPEDEGDVELYFKLPNKMCDGSLKLNFKHEFNMQEKLHNRKEDKTTEEFALYFSTILQLHKSVKTQILEKINDVISDGKEAVVFHANSNPSYPHAILPKECAVKTYKTTLADSKPWELYIEDKHFMSRIEGKSISRTVQLWTQREVRNLFKLHRAGIPCPQPIALIKQHVLVMSFIGENHVPAPQLKHAKMEVVEYEQAYCQVVEAMKNLYNKAKLIHADLSEYNILWHNKQCYFMDVSQSVELNHADAISFLIMNCESITNFFSDKEIPNMKTAHELFTEVTGFDYNNRVQMEKLQRNWRII